MKSQPATEYITRAYNEFANGPRCPTKGYAGHELWKQFWCEISRLHDIRDLGKFQPDAYARKFTLVEEGEGWTLRLEAE